MKEKYPIFLMALLSCSLLIGAQEIYQKPVERELNNRLLNCERNLLYQDLVVNEAIEQTRNGGVLIVVARLGNGERSRALMRRRLHNVRTYFKERGSRLRSDKVIVTEGEPVNGYGRLEYYLAGKLYEQILFPKNGYVCHSCCGPDESYFPFSQAIAARSRMRVILTTAECRR